MMRVPIVIPDLHVGDQPLRVNGWFIDVGDHVAEGDLLVELLIPGVTFDVSSNVTGQLIEIVTPVDALLTQGAILGWIERSIVDAEDRQN